MSALTRIAVVGNGMAGIRLVEELLALGHDGANITVFGAEPGGAYNRILLTAVLAGELQENACISHNLAWYRARGIALRARCPIRTIDRAARQVIAADGTCTSYDRLALALGSQPIRLPLPGAKLPGIMTYRDRGDTRALIAASTAGGRAVVIGGGLLGLEAAAGLARRGMTVTIVHLMPWLMERQLDEEASALVRRALEARGITVRLGAETACFEGDSQVRAVVLKDGSVLPADLAVTAIGIRPETGLASSSGLACGRGIQVDDGMTTSDPAIIALGECIEHGGRTYGLVGPIYEQAKIAAQSLHGRATRYAGSAAATGLKVTGISLYSAGDIGDRDGTQSVIFRDPRRGLYRRLFVRAQGDDTVLTGAILVGAVADGAWYADLIATATPLGGRRHELIFGRAYADSSQAA
jgi:nitrite reductase (NADH) large subunit